MINHLIAIGAIMALWLLIRHAANVYANRMKAIQAHIASGFIIPEVVEGFPIPTIEQVKASKKLLIVGDYHDHDPHNVPSGTEVKFLEYDPVMERFRVKSKTRDYIWVTKKDIAVIK